MHLFKEVVSETALCQFKFTVIGSFKINTEFYEDSCSYVRLICIGCTRMKDYTQFTKQEVMKRRLLVLGYNNPRALGSILEPDGLM